VITSIRERDLGGALPAAVTVAGRSVRVVVTYGQGKPGEILALFGSSGRLEIAVREGSASRQLGLVRGDPVSARVG
jgi:S-adenosylmethionine hydrolase